MFSKLHCVPLNEPIFPRLDLHSPIVQNNVVDTTPSFSNHDYEFTPFLLWPSFPFDPTYAPVTKYLFQQYVSFRNPSDEDTRLKSSIPSFGFRVFPETRFPILDGQTSCLKFSPFEFELICDKKLSLISRLEFFFLFFFK